MQDQYYAAWLGTWPTSIDWTGAVMGTHLSGTLRSLSESLALIETDLQGVEDWKVKENLIENYFTQVVGYYFGENALAIRGEAFDDILWVVLGWIEAVKFINKHTDLYYKLQTHPRGGIADILGNQTWHGNLWGPGMSHRARIFWDLASKGWDMILCGGGMTWNPRLLPYKNAITNELYIAASISMYLYFPGDDNQSPFHNHPEPLNPAGPDIHIYVGRRDPKFLQAAVDGYKWLMSSNMTDSQGLYTDGFHISGYDDPLNNNTKCDERNEMVYTYNQGVLLTGHRGLFDVTGAPSYLTDGHQLIQNVLNATGWDLVNDNPVEDISTLPPDQLPKWHGLGRAGVLEDQCDASGTCSQDAQTFKGIFFHHLAAFCEPLVSLDPGSDVDVQVDMQVFEATKSAHHEACSSYSNWLKHNSEAALNTRNALGVFGSWWTAGLLTNYTGSWPTIADDGIDHRAAGTDYRNYGLPNTTDWQDIPGSGPLPPVEESPVGKPEEQKPMGSRRTKHAPMRKELRKRQRQRQSDPNERGRGRTVETQGSGLGLVRAYWNIAQAL